MSQNRATALGNNLFLRWSTADDKDKIAHLLGMTFRESANEPFSVAMADWVYLCTREGFPFSGPNDWAIVEDRGKPENPAVACTCLWSHQWFYEDIPFGVGRPEFVATDPDYRNRGLIRAIFGLLHEKSEAQGHLMQGITGIPYFYRQFGYEYVLDLGGLRTVPVAQIPAKKEDEPDPYSLRLATPSDLPAIMQLYEESRQESLLWHTPDESYWRLLIHLWNEPDVQSRDPFDSDWSSRAHMVLDESQEVCGYVVLPTTRHGDSVRARQLVFSPNVNLYQCMPSLLRALQKAGESLPCKKADILLSKIGFPLGRHHPIYEVLGDDLISSTENPYAWYIRVPNLPAFIQRITPVLEKRIAESSLVGHTGELKVDLYSSGLLFQFEEGKLRQVEPWRPELYENPNAGCPPLVFLQLLLGYRSLEELRRIFPDVWARKEATLLLNVLFPKEHSVVHPLA